MTESTSIVSKNKKHYANSVRFSIAFTLIAVPLLFMFYLSHTQVDDFAFFRTASRTYITIASSISALFPFSIWDFLALILVVLFVITLVITLKSSKKVARWFSSWLIVISSIWFITVMFWGLNHYAPPLHKELNMDVKEYTASELFDATQYYLNNAASHANLVPRNEDYSLAEQDFYELAHIAGTSYQALCSTYPIYSSSTQPVKKLILLGEPLLWSGSNGIFMPLTGEANVPENCATTDIPFTMCHEAAHRCGIASEQEANYSAFLACITNTDERFIYSGYYKAFVYCLNSLACYYPELIPALIPPESQNKYALVLIDYLKTTNHYERYEGPASTAGQAINDAYLKTFNETEGVQSYGLVTDYLITWHKTTLSAQ